MRQFEIIGEAAKNLSDELRNEHSDIRWKDMAGIRDKLIHHYFGFDMDALWESLQEDLPILIDGITNILRNRQ